MLNHVGYQTTDRTSPRQHAATKARGVTAAMGVQPVSRADSARARGNRPGPTQRARGLWTGRVNGNALTPVHLHFTAIPRFARGLAGLSPRGGRRLTRALVGRLNAGWQRQIAAVVRDSDTAGIRQSVALTALPHADLGAPRAGST